MICKPTGNRHFQPLMKSLYGLFSADRHLLETKGAYIIRQLSIYLSPEDIYQSFAEMIQNEKNLKFARLFVEYLNTIMFTAKELHSLRNSIKMLSTPVKPNNAQWMSNIPRLSHFVKSPLLVRNPTFSQKFHF